MDRRELHKVHNAERYHLIDALRGLAITGVVLYHLLYDIYLFNN